MSLFFFYYKTLRIEEMANKSRRSFEIDSNTPVTNKNSTKFSGAQLKDSRE